MKHYMRIKTSVIKVLLSVTAVIAAMVCLCACGGNGDNKPKQKLDTPQNLCMKIISSRANFVWDEVLLSDYYTIDIN